MKFPVKEGQKIFIKQKGHFFEISNEFEGIITKINTRSFYVRKIDGVDKDYRYRFNKKDGFSNEGALSLSYYEAYPDKKVYEKIIKRIEKKKKLKLNIIDYVKKLELEDLIELEKYIKDRKKLRTN